jgi:hypothetical protein
MKTKKVFKEKSTTVNKENTNEERLFKEMAGYIFRPVEHPYQRFMIESLLLLLEVGDLALIFDCFRILFRAAHMHRGYDEACYWAGQGRIIALAMGDPGRVIEVWTWAAEV